MNWAVVHESCRLSCDWSWMQRELQSSEKPCLCPFFEAFTPANWHHNLHAFFMTCADWLFSLSLYAPTTPPTHPNPTPPPQFSPPHLSPLQYPTCTGSSTNYHTPALSTKLSPEKPQKPSVSPIDSLIQNDISFWADGEGRETLKWIKESRKWVYEWRKQLLKACNSAFSLLIIAAPLV